MCFFSKSTHLTEHITLQHGWHGNHGVTLTHEVTRDPYFIWQLLLVTCLCYYAACVGDQLYDYVYVINTPTASGSWHLWDKVKVMGYGAENALQDGGQVSTRRHVCRWCPFFRLGFRFLPHVPTTPRTTPLPSLHGLPSLNTPTYTHPPPAAPIANE